MVCSSIEIHATPSEVRKVCLEFERIPQWHNGLIESIEPFEGFASPVKVGDKLRYRSNGIYAEPTIAVNSESEFRWKGSAFGGTLNGSHFWRFEPSDQKQGWTVFVHGEDFTGAFAFLFSDWSPAGSWVRGKFDEFNRDLKAEVEGKNTKQTATTP